jgi:hypothetical protein
MGDLPKQPTQPITERVAELEAALRHAEEGLEAARRERALLVEEHGREIAELRRQRDEAVAKAKAAAERIPTLPRRPRAEVPDDLRLELERARAERGRSRELLRRLQSQRDQAQAEVMRLTAEREDLMAEVLRLSEQKGIAGVEPLDLPPSPRPRASRPPPPALLRRHDPATRTSGGSYSVRPGEPDEA